VGFSEGDDRYQPKLRLAVGAGYVNVNSWLLAREKIEAIRTISEHGWTQNDRLVWLASAGTFFVTAASDYTIVCEL